MLNKSFNFLLFVSIFLMFTACEDEFKKGYSEGYSAGENSGYNNGYNSGLYDGKEIGYKDGFGKGKIQGFSDGYHQGEINGSIKGYEEGLSRGENELIVDSLIPTFAGTILILISLITLFFFIKYFHKPIEEKIKSFLYILSNIYMKYILNEKLYIQENHKNEIIDFKTDILVFEFSKQIKETELYSKIDTELMDIENLVKKFIQERQIYEYHQIKIEYKKKINEILKKNIFNSAEKNKLIKELYSLLMKEYLIDIENDKIGIENIQIENFKKEYYIFQEEMRGTISTPQLDIKDNKARQQILEEDNNFNFTKIPNINRKRKDSNVLEIILFVIFFTLIGLLIYYKETL